MPPLAPVVVAVVAMTASSRAPDFPEGRYGAVVSDPPWAFRTWSDKGRDRSADKHYGLLDLDAIKALPVANLAAPDCALFLWATWPMLGDALEVIRAWGFKYKSVGFVWVKVNKDDTPFMGLGYWTRANTEPCLLATRGKPKRLHADVSQVIIEPRREHSRKPDCIHERIERLVGGPYIELWARRSERPGWTFWGDEIDLFNKA